MKFRVFCAAAALAFSPYGLASAQEEGSEPVDAVIDGRLTEIEGEVLLFPHADPQTGLEAEVGAPLEEGDRIRTGLDSRAEIGLDGEHVIELGPRSEFVLARLDRKEPVFTLGLGSLLAKLRSSLFGSAGGRAEIRTPTAVAAVRGTEFAVEYDEAGEARTHVGVFDEGQVAVQGLGAAAPEVLLEGNQELSVSRGAVPGQARPLERFLQRRQRVAHIRERVRSLRRAWRGMPPRRRGELRRSFLRRRTELRRRIQRRRGELKRQSRDAGSQGERSKRGRGRDTRERRREAGR